MRLPALTLLAACAGAAIPAARFAPRADWSYALGPQRAPAEVDRDAMIDDIAYLQHALDEAWPWQAVSTHELAELFRHDAQEIPRAGTRTRLAFCHQLAEAYRMAAMTFAIDGAACGTPRVRPAKAVRIAVPADRNYAWRRDGAVGILTIQRFAPPEDPGWAGFADALREVAATGVNIIDLQDVSGDDPRVGFALLSALGLERFDRNHPRPMVARDTPIAATARANHRSLHPGTRSRDRALWQQFATQAAILAAGHAAFPISRSAPAIKTAIVVGSGCDVACQMIASLATHQDRVETVSSTGVADKLDGDELATIRLPHSGLEVTFATVAYGTDWGGSVMAVYIAGVDLVASQTKGLNRIADQRATQDHWETTPLPDCRELAADETALQHKRSGCYGQSPSGGVMMSLTLSSARAREFLTACGLSVGTTITNPIEGVTIATASGSHEALQRLAHAPFVQVIEWSCPMYPD